MKKQRLRKGLNLGLILVLCTMLVGCQPPPETPDEREVVINEIMFRPGAASSNNQWIELYNKGFQPVDLSGWTVINNTGTVIATLPALDLPSHAYLIVHFGTGIDDFDFSDNDGQYFTQEKQQVFDTAQDEVALCAGSPSTSTIVDFVSYCSDGNYQPGIAHDYAVSAGIWSEDAHLDISFETGMPVWKGDSIGRDSFSTNTDTPDDWSSHGGSDAFCLTRGRKNGGPMFIAKDAVFRVQNLVNVLLFEYGATSVLDAKATEIDATSTASELIVTANYRFLAEIEDSQPVFSGSGVFHWTSPAPQTWNLDISVELDSDRPLERLAFDIQIHETIGALEIAGQRSLNAIYTTPDGTIVPFAEEDTKYIVQTGPHTYRFGDNRSVLTTSGSLVLVEAVSELTWVSESTEMLTSQTVRTYADGTEERLIIERELTVDQDHQLDVLVSQLSFSREGTEVHLAEPALLTTRMIYGGPRMPQGQQQLNFDFRIGNPSTGFENVIISQTIEWGIIEGRSAVRGTTTYQGYGTTWSQSFFAEASFWNRVKRYAAAFAVGVVSTGGVILTSPAVITVKGAIIPAAVGGVCVAGGLALDDALKESPQPPAKD